MTTDSSQNYLDILRSELTAEDGSFLILLRIYNEWNKAAFTRLTTAMQACCEAQENQQLIERWLAEGFWFAYTQTEAILTHPAFRRTHEPEYYNSAIERLYILSCWFFDGRSPFIEGTVIGQV